ncbi:MAG: DUF1275 domain-containing protein [Leptothrix sp. (in: Bacteria)]|nr:DUF1275 domain-containing protein [Leptothrix sp. (in: b-proteobacteria)]
MPIKYLQGLTAPERTPQSNLHLGVSLAFVAGAINAGGFLAVGQYTSHMTGVVSGMADHLALGQLDLVIAGLEALVAFLLGAATSAILINWSRRRGSRSEYALPLMIEAGLLLIFGLMGERLSLSMTLEVSLTIALLCFVMGLQNAMVTKVSNAEIRTTHVTGLVTDIGIELGKLLYWNGPSPHPVLGKVQANTRKLRILLALTGSFTVGSVVGALGFKHVGYGSTVPLALVLALLSSVQFVPQRPSKLTL